MVNKKFIIFLSIAFLIFPLSVQGSDLYVRNKLSQISKNYADSYLTYPGAIKVWYGNTRSKLGLKLSKNLEAYMKGRWNFQFSVHHYSISTKQDTLNLDLSPTEFKSLFNYEVKRQLGDKALKEINLDIHHKYLAIGE